MFSICLGSFSKSGGGEVVFGGIFHAHFTGEQTYLTVTGNRNYFKMNNIIVGTKDTTVYSKGCRVFADSWSTNILGPKVIIKFNNESNDNSFFC